MRRKRRRNPGLGGQDLVGALAGIAVSVFIDAAFVHNTPIAALPVIGLGGVVAGIEGGEKSTFARGAAIGGSAYLLFGFVQNFMLRSKVPAPAQPAPAIVVAS